MDHSYKGEAAVGEAGAHCGYPGTCFLE